MVVAVERQVEQVGVKLFQHVVRAVEGERRPPVFKHAACGTVFRRVISCRDGLLKEESRNHRNVECRITGVFTRDDRARRGVVGSRPDRTLRTTEIARVVVQDAGQESKHKKCGSDLVAFRSTEAFGVRPPALAIVRLSVGGLLDRGLEQVADVRAEIDGLMKLEYVLLSYSQRLLIGRIVVFRLEVWNESEDALRVVILRTRRIRGRSGRLLLGGTRAGTGLLRGGGQIGIGRNFWSGRFGLRRDGDGF